METLSEASLLINRPQTFLQLHANPARRPERSAVALLQPAGKPEPDPDNYCVNSQQHGHLPESGASLVFLPDSVNIPTFLHASLLFFLALGLAAFAATPREQADLLEKRWTEQYLKTGDPAEIARLDAAVGKYDTLIGGDGRFTDLKYGPMITGRDGGPGWGEHLQRVVDLFTAWRTPGTKVQGDADFARRITKPFDVYLAAPFDRNNPWGFGHPYADLLENNRIGRICLFMRSAPDVFPQADIERRANHITDRAIHSIFLPSDDPATRFTKVRPGWEGGANLLWATRGALAPYLVSSDDALREQAIDAYMQHVWESQKVLSPKGPLGQIERLTVDGMLGEHAAPAMGSYGEWYLNAIVEYRDLVQGVEPWQMPEELHTFWIDHLLDSMTHCYQGAIDPHLSNPLVWLNARDSGNAKLKEWLRALSAKSAHRKDEVQKVLEWEPGVTPWPFAERSVRHYYTADHMTKHYPRFMASLRAISERTFGMETFSQKEPKNRWAIEGIMLPLGTTFLRRDTREYQSRENGSAFTAMDFSRLPGQTTRLVKPAELAAAWNRDGSGYAVRMVFGGTPFAGGVEAPQTGIMGWWQSRYVQVDRDRPNEHKVTDLSVSGRRATFFLEDAIVHLGAGFDVRHESEPTLTNLEQRASGAEVTTYAIGEAIKELPRGETASDEDIRWAWHEGVGYIPPSHGRKTLRDVIQPGEPAGQIFSLWSDHGREKNDLSFDWAVIPDVARDDMPLRAACPTWEIVSNTVRVQAVLVPDKDWLGVVFHEPETLAAGGLTITANRPCLMILEKQGDRLRIKASDPLQQGGPLAISVNGNRHEIEFPGYPHAGRTVALELDAP